MQDAALWIVETEAVAVMIFSSLWGASRHCIVVHLFCHIGGNSSTSSPSTDGAERVRHLQGKNSYGRKKGSLYGITSEPMKHGTATGTTATSGLLRRFRRGLVGAFRFRSVF